MNIIERNAVGRWSLFRRVAHLMRGALAFALLCMGNGASPVLAAGEPDLAIAVESLPTLANPMLVLKVTNISPDVASEATQAQVVLQGVISMALGQNSPVLGQVGGGGARIEKLDPGKSTTFSVDVPIQHCSDHIGALLPATATVTAAKSRAGVAEANQSNNAVVIPNWCQQYITDVSNFRPEGVFPQVLIDRRPDEAHPQEVVFRVRNRGKARAPATTFVVFTSSSPVDPNPMDYAIKALDPEESVTLSYVLNRPCIEQQVTAIIRKPGDGNGVYEDTIDNTFVCEYFAAKAAEAAKLAAARDAFWDEVTEDLENRGWGVEPLPAVAIDPQAARCTQFYRGMRRGRFASPRDDAIITQCNELTGWTAYCASRDAFTTLTFAANGTVNGQSCAPYSHPESVGEEFEHLATGIAEGVGDAFTAAAPFMTPVVSGLACVNGVLYSCAILALDVADSLGAGPPAGVARDALNIAHQVSTCADGDVVACAAVGQRGALAAGLDIPLADATQVALFAEKCSRNDFAACAKIGKAAAQTAGVPTNLAGNLANAEDCLSTANGDACSALGKSASKLAGLLGTISQGTENGQKCANGDDKACRALGHAVASAAR